MRYSKTHIAGMLSNSHLETDGGIIQDGLIYKDILRRCEPRSCYHSQTQRGKGKEWRAWGPKGANLTDFVKRRAEPVSEGTQTAWKSCSKEAR